MALLRGAGRHHPPLGRARLHGAEAAQNSTERSSLSLLQQLVQCLHHRRVTIGLAEEHASVGEFSDSTIRWPDVTMIFLTGGHPRSLTAAASFSPSMLPGISMSVSMTLTLAWAQGPLSPGRHSPPQNHQTFSLELVDVFTMRMSASSSHDQARPYGPTRRTPLDGSVGQLPPTPVNDPHPAPERPTKQIGSTQLDPFCLLQRCVVAPIARSTGVPMTVISRNHVVTAGTGPTPMIFAHGFGCDQNMWRFVTPALEADYLTVLFDHVGGGKIRYRRLSGRQVFQPRRLCRRSCRDPGRHLASIRAFSSATPSAP